MSRNGRHRSALAALLCLLLVAGCVGAATAPPPAGAGSATSWVSLPAVPLSARTQAATVWTGHDLIVWGGQPSDSRGADLNVAANRWSLLPPAPIAGRPGAVAAWTGRVLLVWGGRGATDGASYDPTHRVWQRLPVGPLPPLSRVAGWWGGSRLVIAGVGATTSRVLVAAYSPEQQRWQRLPTLVSAGRALVARLWVTGAGRRLVAVAQVRRPPSALFGLEMSELSGGRWRAVALPPSVRGLSRGDQPGKGPVWTGSELMFPPSSGDCDAVTCPPEYGAGAAWNPATGQWRALAVAAPTLLASFAVWTGRCVAVLALGSAACWTSATGHWSSFPAAPHGIVDDSLIWTGRRLVVIGADRYDHRSVASAISLRR